MKRRAFLAAVASAPMAAALSTRQAKAVARAARQVQFPAWFAPFVQPATYKCLYGGRSGGKTRTLAMHLILKAARTKVRCPCVREFAVTLDQSVKPSLQWAIQHTGLTHMFNVGHHRITCPATDSEFWFQGLERNPENVKGWEGVTDVWAEEAQRVSRESAKILIPTVTRGDRPPELWFTWNPTARTDWVWQRFHENPRPNDVIRKVNFDENPFLPRAAIEEIEACRRESPAEFAHVWLGNPDDGDADKTVLPYGLLTPCVAEETWKLYAHQANPLPVDLGLDIADSGVDKNSLAHRAGPLLYSVTSWPTEKPGHLSPTATRAHDLACRENANRLSYDAGGVGAPIRESFFRLSAALNYGLQGIPFGGAVLGKAVEYTRGQTNEQVFSRRNIQMAFAVRIRAINTGRLVRGEPVDVNRCLLIRPDMPYVERLLSQLAQPLWRESPTTGKYELDKRGGVEKSPDDFDSTCLAFSRDCEFGVKLRTGFKAA